MSGPPRSCTANHAASLTNSRYGTSPLAVSSPDSFTRLLLFHSTLPLLSSISTSNGGTLVVLMLTQSCPDVAPSFPGPTDKKPGVQMALWDAFTSGIKTSSAFGSALRALINSSLASSGLLTGRESTKPCCGFTGHGRPKIGNFHSDHFTWA